MGYLSCRIVFTLLLLTAQWAYITPRIGAENEPLLSLSRKYRYQMGQRDRQMLYLFH